MRFSNTEQGKAKHVSMNLELPLPNVYPQQGSPSMLEHSTIKEE